METISRRNQGLSSSFHNRLLQNVPWDRKDEFDTCGLRKMLFIKGRSREIF